MYLIRLKRNVGKTDMIIRITAGSTLLGLGALRVFPGGLWGNAAAIITGVFFIVEGAARYWIFLDLLGWSTRGKELKEK